MELWQYARIVVRRWWLPVALILVVLLASLPGQLSPKPTTYHASMRFAVGVAPEPRDGPYYTYDRYYTWLASEYLIDDLAEIIKSSTFANAVSEELASAGIQVPAGAIGASTQAGKLHRILSVNIAWSSEADLRAIANATAKVLKERNAEFMAQLGTENAEATLIDPPVVFPVDPSLADRLDLPIRLSLALVVGIALAFPLDYLDDSVRSKQELESIGLRVLGEVPSRRRRWLRR